MAKKEFPEIKEKNQGKFTKWVENNMSGKTTCKAASIIVSKNKEEEEKGVKPKQRTYKPSVFEMANYANNFGCSTAKSPAKQTDKKIKKIEEKTERIGIRQGERTRRVEARNNSKKTKQTLENVFTKPIDINDPRFLIKK